MIISRFLQPVYIPIIALFLAILINKVGGNDKAPYLVMAAGLISLVIGIAYLVTLRPLKAMIAIVPFTGLIALFTLSKLGLVDLMPILGFR